MMQIWELIVKLVVLTFISEVATVRKSSTSLSGYMGLKRGTFTCDGWQVTLCDPIWQVPLCSFAMDFPIKSCTRF